MVTNFGRHKGREIFLGCTLVSDSACCPVCIMEERLTWVGLAGEGLRCKAGGHWMRKSRAPGGQRLAPLQ